MFKPLISTISILALLAMQSAALAQAVPVAIMPPSTTVYPGCMPLPTSFNNVWYVDPGPNGQTEAAMTAAGIPIVSPPTASSQGSPAHPWNSLLPVFKFQVTGYPYPLLTTVPYTRNAQGVLSPGPLAGPIQPGDEVLLMSGNYPTLPVGAYEYAINNPAYVTIAAAPGQTPVIAGVTGGPVSGFQFVGLTFTPSAPSNGNLINVGDGGAGWPTRDIAFTNDIISGMSVAAFDVLPFSASQLQNPSLPAIALNVKGSGYTSCFSMTNSHVFGVNNGISLFVPNSILYKNEIDHIDGDGLDWGAPNVIVDSNFWHDFALTSNHVDCTQDYNGLNGLPNQFLTRNWCIRQTDTNLLNPSLYAQGFDNYGTAQTWFPNFQQWGNVLITGGVNGNSYSNVQNGYIGDNTSLSDQSPTTLGGIQLRDGTTNTGAPFSSNVMYQNNVTSQLSIITADPVTFTNMNHNIVLKGAGNVPLYIPINGTYEYLSAPGDYTATGSSQVSATIISATAQSLFKNFNPQNGIVALPCSWYPNVPGCTDLTPLPGSVIAGTGNTVGAPAPLVIPPTAASTNIGAQ